VSQVLRTNEFQVWFITEQITGTALADGSKHNGGGAEPRP
jgi:hypothetical protein